MTQPPGKSRRPRQVGSLQPLEGNEYSDRMNRKTKSSGRTSDRKRVSSQSHEISYAASQLGGRGKRTGKSATAAVRTAKSRLGRVTSRGKVMTRARALI